MSPCACVLPDVEEALADPDVAAALQDAWGESLPDAPEVHRESTGASSKREQGGWIIWPGEHRTYRVLRCSPGTRDRLPSVLAEWPDVQHPEHIVAVFHTHPNTEGEGFVPEPSPGDRRLSDVFRVAAVVLSHHGRFVYQPQARGTGYSET